jgi:hypothetical protein
MWIQTRRLEGKCGLALRRDEKERSRDGTNYESSAGFLFKTRRVDGERELLSR